MKPSIALIRPNYHSHIITPPLGLAYLASSIRKAGQGVGIIDALKEGLHHDQVVRQTAGYSVSGITCMSDHHLETIRLAQALKRAGRLVWLGGPHVTALPKQSLEETGADAVFLGEAENTLPELLGAWPEKPSLDGVLYAVDESSPDWVLPPDLDQLPEPAWDLVPPGSYPIAPHGAMLHRFPAAPLITSRGCPFRCTFCTAPRFHRRKIRFRTPELVLDEIERLVRDFSVREIHFEDNNMASSRSHVSAICEGLLSRGIDVTWTCPNGVRTEGLDDDLLGLMKRSGCYMLAFGIESGNPELLRGIKKDVSLENMLDAVRRASAAGIQTQGFFIFGLPGETQETMRRTIRVAVQSKLDRAQFHLLDVLPGSEMWDEFGQRRIAGWERRGFQEVVWLPEGLTEQDLIQAQKRAFRKFYLRFRILWSFLKDLKLRQIPYFYRRLTDFSLVKRVMRRSTDQ